MGHLGRCVDQNAGRRADSRDSAHEGSDRNSDSIRNRNRGHFCYSQRICHSVSVWKMWVTLNSKVMDQMVWLKIFQDSSTSWLRHDYYLLLLARYAEIILQKVQQKDVKNMQLGKEKNAFKASDRWVKEKPCNLYLDNMKEVLLRQDPSH